MNGLNRVEISKANLEHNVKVFKSLAGDERVLCPAVKANAYGHGLLQCAPIVVEAGADWLGVNSIIEAKKLIDAGIDAPIYVMGYIALDDLEEAVLMGIRFVVYNEETLRRLGEICKKHSLFALTHLKLETGNNRQGILRKDIGRIMAIYRENPLIGLDGVATHFANIEDTIDHSYADLQLKMFEDMISDIKKEGFEPTYRHCANTAASILFPNTYFNMMRAGIGIYGLWPSSETHLSASHEGKDIELKPVLSWKTRIAQIKEVPAGEYIGYGCTYRSPKETKLAILPLGYYDGYDRKLSNTAYVLIHGKRAPIRGRVCMNICMADITEIPEARLEDEVVLLGKQGEETISAEKMASWVGSINYEVVTRINESMERVVV